MSYSSTVRPSDLAAQKQRQDACVNAALAEGCKSAALAGGVSGGLSLALSAVSEAYRFKFTTGPRTAFVVMPVFSAFWFVSEKHVMRCNQKRDNKWQSLDRLNGYEAPAHEQLGKSPQ
ncbi:hypothetical protein Rsub_11057 [Raphidocelis subcapitata]|uniref:Uncharacterized protein n=1 Tax=Raphidocelis subcapitata TaxID=307507 RepID=A0A2V0PLL2_9CHLO|nr:hypothetical protein Rsub_11057 [Raphidocelis subcapitata]|eukprot:GBF98237.1 hypothetical protein Rsub_11057 [Raphidocelis subcapitata]